MSHWSESSFLSEEINLLVRHFGIQRVPTARSKISVEGDEKSRVASRKYMHRGDRPIRTNGANALESMRETDSEKYHLLSKFLYRLKHRDVLPESQDIRYFAQMIGLKEINGKSREDLVTKLIRFLMERPTEKLKVDIKGAANISEQQRKMGFSVLTDKLLGKP